MVDVVPVSGSFSQRETKEVWLVVVRYVRGRTGIGDHGRSVDRRDARGLVHELCGVSANDSVEVLDGLRLAGAKQILTDRNGCQCREDASDRHSDHQVDQGEGFRPFFEEPFHRLWQS